MRRMPLVILILMFAIFVTFATAAPAHATPRPYTTLAYYDGNYTTVWWPSTPPELVTLDVPALGLVNPGPYPYEFTMTEPLHMYLQIRHFLYSPMEGVRNNLTIYLDGNPILNASILWPDWYPGGYGINIIDLGTVLAGTHYINMSAGVADYYGMDWWEISTLPTVPISVGEVTYDVAVQTNSTISNFDFSQALNQTSFNVIGPSGTTGFCNVTIPEALMWVNALDEWKVIIDGIERSRTVTYNGTHYSIYFTYEFLSARTVQIISTYVVPEFPATILLPLLFIISLAAVVLGKKFSPTS